MFEELLKKIVENDNKIFANDRCLISPNDCCSCPIIKTSNNCPAQQDQILSKLKLLVRKERLEKLLKD